MASRRYYRIKCLKDGKVFESLDDVLKEYNMTYDQVAYRLDHVKDYKDGFNFIRIPKNEDALKSVEAVDSSVFVEKFGDKTVPVPGYEDHYTISTKGVITDIQGYGRVIPVKTQTIVRHKVILHNKHNNATQTHSLINLMKKAFGDPEKVESES